MIKLRIENSLYGKEKIGDYHEPIALNSLEDDELWLKSYDADKWMNGKIYEFNTLKEAKIFADQAEEEIDFSDKFEEDNHGKWEWQVLDFDLEVSDEEDNLLVLYIGSHVEF